MLMLAALSGMLTGFALGIFGSGGGIIVVPALIYLLHLPPKEAIAMGLGIIAITASLTTLDHWRAKNIDWRAAATFSRSRMALAMRPCLPITLPMSPSAT